MKIKTKQISALDSFTGAYLECALWSSGDNSTEQGDEPFDANYTLADIAPETLQRMAEDCAEFQADNHADIEAGGITSERAGFLFWLNRNGHGSGFWDQVGGGHELHLIFMRLSEASKAWGTFGLYLGDDDKIHGN